MAAARPGGASRQVAALQSQPNRAVPPSAHSSPRVASPQPPAAMMMMMQMWFYQSCEATILFENWTTTDCSQYGWSIFAVILMGMARQLVVALRRNFRSWVSKQGKPLAGMGHDSSGPGCSSGACAGVAHAEPGFYKEGAAAGSFDWVAKSPLAVACIDGFLSFLAVSAAFLNMLVTMTYNGGLFLGICAGEALGVVAFDPALSMCGCHKWFAASDGQMAACH